MLILDVHSLKLIEVEQPTRMRRRCGMATTKAGAIVLVCVVMLLTRTHADDPVDVHKVGTAGQAYGGHLGTTNTTYYNQSLKTAAASAAGYGFKTATRAIVAQTTYAYRQYNSIMSGTLSYWASDSLIIGTLKRVDFTSECVRDVPPTTGLVCSYQECGENPIGKECSGAWLTMVNDVRNAGHCPPGAAITCWVNVRTISASPCLLDISHLDSDGISKERIALAPGDRACLVFCDNDCISGG